MKKIMILAVLMAMNIVADAMSYKAARKDALFLSDKMAHELSLTAEHNSAPAAYNKPVYNNIGNRPNGMGRPVGFGGPGRPGGFGGPGGPGRR